MKFSTVITGTIIGAVLFGWTAISNAAESKNLSDYTELKVGEKVLLNKDKLKAGTVEDIAWKYLNALAEGNIEKIKTLASKERKLLLATKYVSEAELKKAKFLDFDLTKDFYIRIKKEGDKGTCEIYGYSKASKSEKKLRIPITIEDDKVTIADYRESLFK